MPLSLNYLTKRIIWIFLVVVGVVIFSYVAIIASPGDPAVKWAGNPRGPNASLAIELARKELGLDKPPLIQVLKFMTDVFTGNIGLSIAYKIPVFEVILRRLVATLELLFVTYLIAIPLGVFLGIESALHRGSKLDTLLQSLGTVLANTPTFWVGAWLFLSLILLGAYPYGRVDPKLATATGFYPITGFYLIDSLIEGNILVFTNVLSKIIPPAIAIAIYPIGVLVRLTRALVSDTLLEDYIRASVAWGVSKSVIIWRYTLKAITPGLVQVIGLAFAYSLIDAMAVEYVVFGREGLGSLLIDSLNYSDFRLAIGLVIVVAVFYLLVNTLTDIIQALIDPKVRL
ncbi:MAG: ABC transporter permease [Desulfurococcaceae archaeon TW002]